MEVVSKMVILVVWNMNQDIKDDLIVHETWSSNSENWEQSSHLLQSLLYTIKFALSLMKC